MSDVLTRKPPPADHRIPYAAGEFRFGDLRLPTLAPGQLAPVLVFLHGGWWKAEYDLDYGGHLCAGMKADGFASWSIEYRRVGNSGGGWPGTFEDVAAGYDFLATLAKTYPLDLSRVVVAGHSAGGHLAYWLAGRHHLPETGPLSKLRVAAPMRGVVALAGAVDLRLTIDLAGWFTFAHDKQMVLDLMGATPAAAQDRYRAANPGELLPLNVPQFLVQGTEDDQIPSQLPVRWADRARRMGEVATLTMIPGADHFDIVDPESKAWSRVREVILKAASSQPL
jgi:acetyl esterase/lipase